MAADIRLLDLFAGAGGLSAGLEAASGRYRPVEAVELDAEAAASFEATFGPELVYQGDIRTWLDSHAVPEVDVVIGGPPCQGFSSLGKQDASDDRNSLWVEYAETVKRANPKYFVIENVPEFQKSRQFSALMASTKKNGILEGYELEVAVLNSADFGAPQVRRRTVVIGHHRDMEATGMPAPTHASDPDSTGLKPYVTVRNVLGRINRVPDRDSLFERRRIEFRGKEFAGAFKVRDLHWSRNYTQLSLDRFEVIPLGGNRRDLEKHPELMTPCWTKHRSGSGDVMGRMNWTKPSVTIRTEFFKPEKGRYLHPEENRAITHYEAALLQGFKPDHKFVGSRTSIARQIGNAVPIPLGEAIGRLLADQF